MTHQKKLKAALVKSGIPSKEINCYGSQIVVTCWSRDAAEKFAHMLGMTNGAYEVRGITESLDETVATQGKPYRRDYVKVWRMFACVA